MHKFALLLLALLAFAAPANAEPKLPAPLEKAKLSLSGHAELNVWFYKVYKANLYVTKFPWSMNQPFALVLEYQHDFIGSDIVRSSLEQMKRIDRIDQATLESWRAPLTKAFPNVKKGDRLTGYFTPPSRVRFYHNDRLTYEFNDPRFAKPFFNIWLSEKTREPKLRATLLGLKR